ncbi:hypothetical protein DFR86_11395 [Acidianus sulfidivorans JP7]|uniref:CRISPR type III-B/RAMP module-associated protein Cmr5 n=1 Tax=Acidianus sulfidivorans JP7 TaxID=619593 RepID=A0A2U9IPU9_9CREN|nr:hypothetical protein [Acidianus sulfidivorans]AWR98079.1 hypothetical protein DFR86_11395 [Acidianus sulfidivorans JP7]
MQASTQTDFKTLGVETVCKIKKKNKKESPSENQEEENSEKKNRLTRTVMRKIYDIVLNSADNMESIIPDLLYLGAQRVEREDFNSTEIGMFLNKLIQLIKENKSNKENVLKFLEGAVMATYVIEKMGEKAYSLLGCDNNAS